MKLQTISARVDVHTRRLAEAAAELRGVTLSAFAAEAIEEEAKRMLLERRPPNPIAVRQDNDETIYLSSR